MSLALHDIPELIERLAQRLQDIERRLRNQEKLEYIARASNAGDADTVDGIHASAAVEPDKLLALDSNGRFPSHYVTGALGMTGNFDINGLPASGEMGVITRIGYKNNWVADTPYDMLTFTNAGGGDSTQYRASVSGLLIVTAQGRNTSNQMATASAVYLVTVLKNSNQTMASVIQRLGNANLHKTGGNDITITVAQKSGASSTSLTIVVTFTYLESLNTFCVAGWDFWGVQYSNYASSTITVTAVQG